MVFNERQALARQALFIRPMHAGHADTVLAIYQEGIDSGHATFAVRAPSWDDWSAGHLRDCRLVCALTEDARRPDSHVSACGQSSPSADEAVCGWAALSPFSARDVYRGVCEVSIYVGRLAHGRGAGRALLEALVTASEAAGIWTLQAGIFPENETSIALHGKCGFKVLGVRERIGLMTHGPQAGCWRDVVLMERRSAVAGIEQPVLAPP